jgi:hypothetical protein
MIYKVYIINYLESIDKFLKFVEQDKSFTFNIQSKKFLMDNQALIEINKKKANKFWVFLFETDIVFFQFYKGKI